MVESAGKAPGGASGHSVTMYGLSTCVWCKKMRQFLESEGIEFDVVYVDELKGTEQRGALAEVRKWTSGRNRIGQLRT